MKYRLLEWLCCPQCRCPDLSLRATRTRTLDIWKGAWSESDSIPGLDRDGRSLRDIVEGELSCPQCGSSYPITNGIPRMLIQPEAERLGSGHRWTRFNGSEPEFEANFRDMTYPARPEDYLGQLVLEVGAGYGRHAFFAARYGAEVIAMDHAADAVDSCMANCEQLQRVHVIQGDLFHPPVRAQQFDIVHALGVLHHLQEPREGFAALHDLLQPGGRLQVWCYGPRQGSVKWVSQAMHGYAAKLSDEGLFSLSQSLARSIRLFSHTPYRLFSDIPGLKGFLNHLPVHDHHQWPFEVLVADIYDRLRVPVTEYVTGEELERWFADDGYSDIQVNRRVRNNESFRGRGTRR